MGLKPRGCLEGRQVKTTIQTTGAYDRVGEGSSGSRLEGQKTPHWNRA